MRITLICSNRVFTFIFFNKKIVAKKLLDLVWDEIKNNHIIMFFSRGILTSSLYFVL